MVAGTLLAVMVDAEIQFLRLALAQRVESGTAPVADDKVVMGMAEGQEVAPVNVVGGTVVFDETPGGTVKNNAAGGVVIKGTVCHGDMTCFIFVVGTVHPDIDRLAAVHEGEIFNVDETAVDAETDPVSEK